MKQAEDTYTLDMHDCDAVGHEEVITPDNSTAKKHIIRYRFYIITRDGEEIEWFDLSKKQARDMYAYTSAHQPSNAVRYGWEECK